VRSLAAAVAAVRKKPDHGLTVWRRDYQGTAWAWSCLCGRRYDTDLPTKDAAHDEGMQHQRPITTP
jgi:hypothetical protein